MSQLTLIAIIQSIGPVVLGLGTLFAALGAVYLGRLNSRKADGIHVLVNAQLSELKAELKAAKEHGLFMQRLVEKVLRNGTIGAVAKPPVADGGPDAAV